MYIAKRIGPTSLAFYSGKFCLARLLASVCAFPPEGMGRAAPRLFACPQRLPVSQAVLLPLLGVLGLLGADWVLRDSTCSSD